MLKFTVYYDLWKRDRHGDWDCRNEMEVFSTRGQAEAYVFQLNQKIFEKADNIRIVADLAD